MVSPPRLTPLFSRQDDDALLWQAFLEAIHKGKPLRHGIKEDRNMGQGLNVARGNKSCLFPINIDSKKSFVPGFFGKKWIIRQLVNNCLVCLRSKPNLPSRENQSIYFIAKNFGQDMFLLSHPFQICRQGYLMIIGIKLQSYICHQTEDFGR